MRTNISLAVTGRAAIHQLLELIEIINEDVACAALSRDRILIKQKKIINLEKEKRRVRMCIYYRIELAW